MKGIIGKKLGMTQLFDTDGKVTPVTVIQAGPCFVTAVRNAEQNGYTAVQLGYEEVTPDRLAGGERGHFQKRNLPTLKHVREFRVKEIDVTEGQRLTVEVFTTG